MTAQEEYVNNKLQKAISSLNAAIILCENNMHEEAVPKLYYAMFNSALALLITKKLMPKTHSGVKSLFHKEFIHSGKLPLETGKLYDFLLMKRFETDYEEFPLIDKDEVEGHIADVKLFIEKSKEIISRNNG